MRSSHLYTLASAGLFSLITPIASILYQHGGNALTAIALRAGCIALFALAYLLITRQKLGYQPRHRLPLIIMTIALFIQGAGYLGSVAYISVGLAAILFYTWPLWVALAAPFFGAPRLSGPGWLAFALAFIGLTLAIGPNLSQLDWHGIALAIAGSLALAIYVLVGQRYLADFAVFPTILVTNLGAMLGCFTIIGVSAIPLGLPQDHTGWLAMGAIGGIYILAASAQLVAMQKNDPTSVAMLFNLEPVISIMVAALFLGEMLEPNQYMGGLLVLAALFLYQLGQSRLARKNAPPPVIAVSVVTESPD